MFPLEVAIGPLAFEYDRDSQRMYVHYGERRTAGWVVGVSEQDWLAFYALASTPQAQGAPLR
jgi:hypothetical protein